MSGYRIPVDAHSILYRPCPWCTEWTPVGRPDCIECEEEIAADRLRCGYCQGEGHVTYLTAGAGSPHAIGEAIEVCERCEGNRWRYPDPPPDVGLIEWWSGDPGEDGSEIIRDLCIEPEAENSPWLWELRPVNGSTWVRAAGTHGEQLYIVTEDAKGRVHAYHRTIGDVTTSGVVDDIVHAGLGSTAGSMASAVIGSFEPVPLKAVEQDLEAALKASLKGGG